VARGGKREGAGRKPGIPSRRNAAVERAVRESGLTPLDYLLSVMRDESEGGEVRRDAAKAAAPYCHSKLQSLDMTARVGHVTDEDLKWLGDGG
jgi:hypothetical protein